jgi:cytoskeletal protein RodZ
MTSEESGYEMEEEAIAAETEPYAYETATETEPQKRDKRVPWIVGGLAAVALIFVICCCLLVTAYFVGQALGGGAEPAPPPTEVQPQQPTQTTAPDATVAPEATPTSGQAPQAVINYPAEANVGEEVAFDGSQSRPGSSPIASYDWDFGDGNRGSGAVVSHIYNAPGVYQVTLTVTGEDGLSNTGGPIRITIQPAATAEPEPTPLPPVIDGFEVTPEEVKVGECVDVSWSASGATSWVNILRDDEFLWENAPLSGSVQDCPDVAGAYLYRMVAYNPEDDRVREDLTVTVTE